MNSTDSTHIVKNEDRKSTSGQSPYVAPSIDNTEITWGAEQAENILSSFRQLICPRIVVHSIYYFILHLPNENHLMINLKRCYKYDCHTHCNQYRPPSEHYELGRRLDMKKLPKDCPCSEDCFQHVPGTSFLEHEIFF